MTNKNSGLRVIRLGSPRARREPAMTSFIEYGLYALAFLLPLGTRWIIKAGVTEYTTYSLYVTDILLIAVLLLFIIYKFSIFNFQFSNNFQLINFQKKFKSPTFSFIAGLVIVSLISVIFALNKVLALYKFGWLVLGTGLFWLIGNARYEKLKLIWCLLAGLALESALAIRQFFTQDAFAFKWLGLSLHRAADLGTSVIETIGADGAGERWLRAYGGLDHPNILGGVLAIGIIWLINLIITDEKSCEITNYPSRSRRAEADELRITNKIKNAKIVMWLFLILFSAALFFSFSRAGWLALIAGLAAMMAGAVLRKDYAAQKKILEIILISGAVFFILFRQYPNLIMTRLYPVKSLRNDSVVFNGVNGGERLEIKSASERIESIKNALPIIKKNWLAGAGPGNYVLALERNIPGRENYFYQPAHNVFILVFSEIGIIGFIIFILIIIYLLIFNFQIPIFKQFSNTKFSNFSLKIENCKLKIGRTGSGADEMVSLPILIALIVLLSLDHWLWSLHFGVLFFWLTVGLIAAPSVDK